MPQTRKCILKTLNLVKQYETCKIHAKKLGNSWVKPGNAFLKPGNSLLKLGNSLLKPGNVPKNSESSQAIL